MRPRRTKITILIVGEGSHDCAFLIYLKALYFDKQSDLCIPDPHNGHGVDPWTVTEKAARLAPDYDKTYVLVDIAKKDWPHEHKPKILSDCQIYHIEQLWAEPCCLEGFLLTILGVKKVPLVEQQCKDAWAKYSKNSKLNDKRTYEIFFPLSFLELKRKSNPLLDKIINIMINGV
jgi:hypothetical protein